MRRTEREAVPVLPGMLLLGLLLAASMCVPLREGDRRGEPDRPVDTARGNLPGTRAYAPGFLEAPPNDIASLQLHPLGDPSLPPVVNLEGGDPLVLEFDRLGSRSGQFRVRVTHRNRDWEQSSLSPYEYMDGFHEATYGGGRPDIDGPPSYYHYRMLINAGEDMPGGRLGTFRVSGNYLLEVFEPGGREPLFSLPFLVTEGEGELRTETQTLYTSSTHAVLRSTLLLSDYRYPGEITFPQFDLHAAWVPDLHWGRLSGADVRESSVPGVIRFRQERSSAWPNNYFRRYLDLRLPSGYGTGSPEIREVRRDTLPHRVILERDRQSFPERPPAGILPDPALGRPSSPRTANYVEVAFTLETGTRSWHPGGPGDYSGPGEVELYLAGSFNGWRLEPRHRMRYDGEEEAWKGTALIKEGEYWYGYLLRQPGGGVRSLGPLPSAGEPPHQILSMVYYRDPSRNFDRLLQTDLRR